VEELAAHAAALTTAADTRVRAAEAALAAYDANLPATDRACLAALAEVVQTVYDDRQPLAPVLLSTGADDPFVAVRRRDHGCESDPARLGNYFRTDNAADRFHQIDRYVVGA
jgi:hypothetical protein